MFSFSIFKVDAKLRMDDPIRRPWFYGRISRGEAEKYLSIAGREDGRFLLRKRPTDPGSYALSVCHDNYVIHYHIQRHPDGKYGIEDGPRFANPVELIEYHRSNQGGLLTTLSSPCNRPAGVEPKIYTNVYYSEVQAAAAAAMEKLGVEKKATFGNKSVPFEQMLGMLLHTKQDWFHGNISRDEAESRLKKCGCKTGLFLVRERERSPGTYAIGLCNSGGVYHYLLDLDASGKLSIQSGPKFSNLMECVEYYLNRSDGLVCKLSIPCPLSNFQRPKPPSSTTNNQTADNQRVLRENPPPLPSVPSPSNSAYPMHRQKGNSSSQTEAIYDTVAMKKSPVYHNAFKGMKTIDFSRLTLQDKIGQGNFGSVLKGVYKLSNGKKIEVAVKQLKTEGIATQKSEIEHEARIMMNLDHPNIVRMIGMCHDVTMMLVMELAASGPLHKYLKRHKGLSPRQILILMLQVSEGMAYLDSMHFVHRDLAARNVLVVNSHYVKISDFGMSRAMGVGNDYYKAERAGKWPLKWYAPECIYFFKFTTKSDVWSYGITMWEALTFGGKPYDGLQGQEVIQFLENNQRLACPAVCPRNVYALMSSCWEFQPEERPSFSEIKDMLSSILMHQMQV